MKHATQLLALSLAMVTSAYAEPVPNTFADGDVISAAEMNANFSSVADGAGANTALLVALTDRVVVLEAALTTLQDAAPLVVDSMELAVPGDYASIQEAIDSTNGVVFRTLTINVAPGTYDQGLISIHDRPGVINISGAGTTLNFPAGEGFNVTNSRVNLSGLNLVGNGGYGKGLYVAMTADLRTEQVNIRNFGFACAVADGGGALHLTDAELQDCGTGIYANHGGMVFCV